MYRVSLNLTIEVPGVPVSDGVGSNVIPNLSLWSPYVTTDGRVGGVGECALGGVWECGVALGDLGAMLPNMF